MRKSLLEQLLLSEKDDIFLVLDKACKATSQIVFCHCDDPSRCLVQRMRILMQFLWAVIPSLVIVK